MRRAVPPAIRARPGRGLALLLLLALGLPRPAPAQPAAPEPAVVVAPVAAEPVRAPAEFIGRVEAIRALDVRARVGGYVQEVSFEEGARVEAGQVLFVLDPAQYEAELASVEARLAGARATAGEARRNLARNAELRRSNTVPQARVDEAEAAFQATQAEALAAEAAVALARLNLSYTRIETSIEGRIGRAPLTVGALAGPESGALARVVQLDPIRVVFSLTEGAVVDFRLAQRRGEVTPGGAAFRIRLPNGEGYAPEGRLDFVASEVDSGTGTVAVRVAFPNPDGILLPGQFVTMVVNERAPARLPVVPFAAVQRDREGTFVFVLDGNGAAARRRIGTGARLRTGWAVTEGLAEGETVVVQGVQRLRDGTRVRAVPQGSAQGSAGLP